MEDTEFYYDSITETLVGNTGTLIDIEFLEENADILDKQALQWSVATPSIYYLFKNVIFARDPITDTFIFVIDARTGKYLYVNERSIKNARAYAKSSGEKRWTKEKFENELTNEGRAAERRKKKFQKFMRRSK